MAARLHGYTLYTVHTAFSIWMYEHITCSYFLLLFFLSFLFPFLPSCVARCHNSASTLLIYPYAICIYNAHSTRVCVCVENFKILFVCMQHSIHRRTHTSSMVIIKAVKKNSSGVSEYWIYMSYEWRVNVYRNRALLQLFCLYFFFHYFVDSNLIFAALSHTRL